MEVYAGLDLHSTNTYVAMIDKDNKVLYKQRHGNDVPTILSALDPFKKDIKGVVVESTYNWYWLVDALMDAGNCLHLANVSAIKQYEGLKQIDDRRSSLGLANLLRLNILPTGYIYPKEERPTRDLLRKRLHLVRHRTSHVLSVKNILARNLGIRMKSEEVKKLNTSDIKTLFPDSEMRVAVAASVGLISHLENEIKGIEAMITRKLKVRKEFTNSSPCPVSGRSLVSRSCWKWAISIVSPPWGITPHTAGVSGASGPKREDNRIREQEKRQQVSLLGLR